ncbi:predicted protein [Naegleria gruberi]|uniref:Predicted protein n=1 Tax=Naegleria gruberi TaxID=5762 RepID=D2VJB2_NAEGR|nr:uncharacterized protein NAEGRDRAFT_68975 [Naegleria gruberi]EFC43009.1 predicted protein [Naegleria gruberi]|eukprot:XP_002675753.1 predicted protein [Naegleria gruberi strain NEG-M]
MSTFRFLDDDHTMISSYIKQFQKYIVNILDRYMFYGIDPILTYSIVNSSEYYNRNIVVMTDQLSSSSSSSTGSSGELLMERVINQYDIYHQLSNNNNSNNNNNNNIIITSSNSTLQQQIGSNAAIKIPTTNNSNNKSSKKSKHSSLQSNTSSNDQQQQQQEMIIIFTLNLNGFIFSETSPFSVHLLDNFTMLFNPSSSSSNQSSIPSFKPSSSFANRFSSNSSSSNNNNNNRNSSSNSSSNNNNNNTSNTWKQSMKLTSTSSSEYPLFDPSPVSASSSYNNNTNTNNTNNTNRIGSSHYSNSNSSSNSSSNNRNSNNSSNSSGNNSNGNGNSGGNSSGSSLFKSNCSDLDVHLDIFPNQFNRLDIVTSNNGNKKQEYSIQHWKDQVFRGYTFNSMKLYERNEHVLFDSIRICNLPILKLIIEKFENCFEGNEKLINFVNHENRNGITPLHLLHIIYGKILNSCKDLISHLEEKGANLNIYLISNYGNEQKLISTIENLDMNIWIHILSYRAFSMRSINSLCQIEYKQKNIKS